eukprot:g1915.t1
MLLLVASLDVQSRIISDIVKIPRESNNDKLIAYLRSTLAELENENSDKYITAHDTVAVIGAGLSGLTAAYWLLENDVKVLLVDKNAFIGGNSAKASSGLNGCPTEKQKEFGFDKDSIDQFFQDTIVSSGRTANTVTGNLIKKMVDDSALAVEWISSKAVNLSRVGQLGGHSFPRTHRPKGRLAGAAIINGLERGVKRLKNEHGKKLTFWKRTKLEKMSVKEDGLMTIHLTKDGKEQRIGVGAVILATGGYGSDNWGNNTLIGEVAPHLTHYRTTNGKFATGDGIKVARQLGAGIRDLEQIQVHPTGFSDLSYLHKNTSDFTERPSPLVLCAEILRGVGGILLNSNGERFVDELDTRKNVVARMKDTGDPRFTLALPKSATSTIAAHIGIYTSKKLLNRVHGSEGIAGFIEKSFDKKVSLATIEATLSKTSEGTYGIPRKVIPELPLDDDYFVGLVEPVLHYTMGGLNVDTESRVLDAKDNVIPRLLAAGEIMGGVHGENRLGGSSLLDCVVYGLASAKSAKKYIDGTVAQRGVSTDDVFQFEIDSTGQQNVLKKKEETGLMNTESSGDSTRKIVEIRNVKYDITEFASIHPGGPIHVKKNEDLTKRFTEAHGEDFDLIKRDTIFAVSETGKRLTKETTAANKEEEEHHLTHYGGKGGGWRELLGRHTWFFLHSIAAKYPDNPTDYDKQTIRWFIAALGQHYPCKLCRGHLQQQLRDPDLGPVQVDNRKALSVWMCNLHNMVNRDIGKPEFDCNPFKIDLMYLKNCGECEHKSPDPNKVIDPRTQSGYHEETGPWNPELYARDTYLLQTIESVTDEWRVLDLLERLDTAKVKGLISRKKYKRLMENLYKGKTGQRKVAKILREVETEND